LAVIRALLVVEAGNGVFYSGNGVFT